MCGGYGSEGPWHDGELREVEGPPVMCEHGYHAGKTLFDALRYAPGPIICRVELSGDIITDTDKHAATKRRLLWRLDRETSERILHEFACWVAEDALKRERATGREPDERSWAAIEAKRKWLRGEITDDELAAARDAAWDATSAAYAAGDAAGAAAGERYDRKLERMILNARKKR